MSLLKNETRAFRPEFLIHMAPFGGLPPIESIRLWGREKRMRFIRNGQYAPIRTGEAGKVSHLRMIVAYLIDPRHRNLDEWRGVSDYLIRQGLLNPASLDDATIFDMITTDSEPPDQGVQPSVMFWTFDKIMHPNQYVRPFKRTEVAEVKEALGWMCIDVGRQVTGNPDLEPFKALDVAEQRMRTTATEYQKKILALWEVNPWVVVRAVRDGEVKGLCICLPLTKAHYDELSSGKGISYNTPADQIEPCCSRWIVLEGLATTAFEHSRKRRPGVSLVMAMLCQQAYLSDIPGCPEHDELTMLSFTGTPVGEARLKRFGYMPTGTKMGGLDIDFMQRKLHLEGSGLRDAALIGIWKGLQKALREAYPRAQRPGVVVVPPRAVSPVTC
jgi:hypothetical protein